MIGESVRKIRKMRGMTQRELARIINVKPNTLCQYELGKSEISLSVLMEIAEALNCSINDLIYGDLSHADSDDDILALPQNFNSRVAQCGFSSIDDKIMSAVKLLDVQRKNKVLEYIRDQLMASDYLKISNKR